MAPKTADPRDPVDQQDYRDEIGRRLRGVRHQQDLTLAEVETRTEGRFTASAVARWERADRTITALKLVELADFYGVPADQLFPDSHRGPSVAVGRHLDRLEAVTVDLRAIRRAGHPGTEIIVRYVDHIRQRRDDHATRISIRRNDLPELAALLGVTVDDCRRLLAEPTKTPVAEGFQPAPDTTHPDDPRVIIDLRSPATRKPASRTR